MNKLEILRNIHDMLSDLPFTLNPISIRLGAAALTLNNELICRHDDKLTDLDYQNDLFDLAHALNDALTLVEAQRDLFRKRG